MFCRTIRDELRQVDQRREKDYDNLNAKYWRLRHEFQLLVDHLGLHIEEQKARTSITAKGGPEKPK